MPDGSVLPNQAQLNPQAVNAYLFGVVSQQLYIYWVGREYYCWWQVSRIGNFGRFRGSCICEVSTNLSHLMNYRDSHVLRVFVVAQFVIIILHSALYVLIVDSLITRPTVTRTRLCYTAWNAL